MHIIAQCPHCGCRRRLAADTADRHVPCGRCGGLLRVPDLSEIPDAVRIIEQATAEVHVDDAGRTYG